MASDNKSLRPLTAKQAKFTTEYLKNGRNGFKAALEAYDLGQSEQNLATARQMASENLTKPNIQAAILALLSKSKPIEEKITTVIDDAMRCDESIISAQAHGIRLRGADMAARLIGAYPDQDQQSERRPTTQINIGVSDIEMRYIVLHGRKPTDAELRQLQGDTPQAIDITADTGTDPGADS